MIILYFNSRKKYAATKKYGPAPAPPPYATYLQRQKIDDDFYTRYAFDFVINYSHANRSTSGIVIVDQNFDL